MTTHPPPALRAPKALKTVLVLHLVVIAVLSAFGFYIMPKAERLSDLAPLKLGHQKMMAAIANETDIERLRDMARRGWEQSDRDWHVMATCWKAFQESYPGLIALSVSTAFFAWWGLTRPKPARK